MSKYTSYITSEHQKDKFLAVVAGLTQPFDDIENMSIDMNLNTATGYFLDIIGEWVGHSRYLSAPIDVHPTNWDTLLYGGWDTGTWYNEFDTINKIISLDDNDYRFLLKLQIAQNLYDGRAESAYEILKSLKLPVAITDNQDMTCDVVIIGVLTRVQEIMLNAGIVNIAPFGVSSTYTIYPTKLFMFDTPTTSTIGGYDDGGFII